MLSAVQVPGLGAGRGGWEGGLVGVKVWFFWVFLGGFCGRGLFFCLFLLVWWEVVGFFLSSPRCSGYFWEGGCAVVREYMEIMAGALYIDWTGCWL